MAITRIGSAVDGGFQTVAIPAHQAGDLIVIWAYRDGSNTLPGIPAGWTNAASSGGNTNSCRVAWRIATDSATVSGTWTSATSLIAVVYRATGTIGVGAAASVGGANTIVEYAPLTLTGTPGNSWVVGFAGHRATNTALETPPAGMTFFQGAQDATDEVAAHDTNGPVSSWAAANVSVGGTSSGFRTGVIEITEIPPYEPPAGFNPSNIAPGKVVSWVDVSTATMFQDAAGTIPAAVGDPVGFISDGASATPYLRMGSENRPILRQYADGSLYLESTSAAPAGLQSTRSVTFGAFFAGARIRRPAPNGDILPMFGVTKTVYPNAYWQGAALDMSVGSLQYPHFGGDLGDATNLPNEEYRDLGIIQPYLPMGFPSCVHMGINASAQTVLNINGRQRETGSKTGPFVAQNYASLWFLAPSGGGGALNDIGHTEISRFYILNAEPTLAEEAELLEWLTWGDAGAPAAGSNPSTIMGDAALSWFDATEANNLINDLTTMSAPALGDPVRAVRDGTGRGQYGVTPLDLAITPVMGDGHIAFTGQALNQFIQRTGQVWIGMRRAHTSTFTPNSVPSHFVMSGDNQTWWGGDWQRLSDNGYGSDWSTFFETSAGGLGKLGDLNFGADVGVFFNDMFGFDAGGVPRMSRNGVDRTGLSTNASAPGQTTRITSVGGILDNRTVNAAESSDNNITRFYILTEEPTPEQEAALLAWLEAGDPGPAPTGIVIERGAPQSFENVNNSTNITIPIGAEAADRIILVTMSGEKPLPLALPTGATLGGNPMTLVQNVTFTSIYDDVSIAAIYAIEVPAGTADLTLNYSMTDSAFSAIVTPYRITGAAMPSGGPTTTDIAGDGGITATVVDNGALISMVRQGGTTDNSVLFDGVAVDTVETQNFYGSGRIYDSFAGYATGEPVTVTLTGDSAIAIAVPLAPAGAEPPLTGITGSLSAQETGTDAASISMSVATQAGLSAQETGSDSASATVALPVSAALSVQEIEVDDASGIARVGISATSAAQEEGLDDASGIARATVTATASAQETGNDTAAATLAAPLSLAVSAQEQGSDAGAIEGRLDIAAALSARDSGSDAASASATVAASAAMTVQEQDPDQISAQITVPVAAALTVQEQGEDGLGITAALSIAAALSAAETGKDIATISSSPVNGAVLSVQETGEDGATAAVTVSVTLQGAIAETGQDQARVTALSAAGFVMAAREAGFDEAEIQSAVRILAAVVAGEQGQDSAVISASSNVISLMQVREALSDGANLRAAIAIASTAAMQEISPDEARFFVSTYEGSRVLVFIEGGWEAHRLRMYFNGQWMSVKLNRWTGEEWIRVNHVA